MGGFSSCQSCTSHEDMKNSPHRKDSRGRHSHGHGHHRMHSESSMSSCEGQLAMYVDERGGFSYHMGMPMGDGGQMLPNQYGYVVVPQPQASPQFVPQPSPQYQPAAYGGYGQQSGYVTPPQADFTTPSYIPQDIPPLPSAHGRQSSYGSGGGGSAGSGGPRHSIGSHSRTPSYGSQHLMQSMPIYQRPVSQPFAPVDHPVYQRSSVTHSTMPPQQLPPALARGFTVPVVIPEAPTRKFSGDAVPPATLDIPSGDKGKKGKKKKADKKSAHSAKSDSDLGDSSEVAESESDLVEDSDFDDDNDDDDDTVSDLPSHMGAKVLRANSVDKWSADRMSKTEEQMKSQLAFLKFQSKKDVIGVEEQQKEDRRQSLQYHNAQYQQNYIP